MKAHQSQKKPSSVPLWENSYGARLRAEGNGPWPSVRRRRADRGSAAKKR